MPGPWAGPASRAPVRGRGGRLAVRALETGQPERYMWIDESGVVSRVGSSPAKPHSRRKHNPWIPPSTGWTALNARAQQLVADVLLLLNLAERGRPPQRDRRLQNTNKNHLPPCLAENRFPLDHGRGLRTRLHMQDRVQVRPVPLPCAGEGNITGRS